MTINRNTADDLLARCHRRCCICHRFCGGRMEIHHIQQAAREGGDNLENLIPLCFDCHAEVGQYNSNHPKGRKYHPSELSKHRDQWLELCSRNPSVMISASISTDAGPLQGLLGELEFNLAIAKTPGAEFGYPCPISSRQFERVISEGSLLILPDDIKQQLLDLYCKLWGYNVHVRGFENKERSMEHKVASTLLQKIRESKSIENCLQELRRILGGDDQDNEGS